MNVSTAAAILEGAGLSDIVSDHIEESAGLVQLGRMIGIRSMNRNLRTEDSAVERDMAANHANLFGGNPAAEPASEDMDIMAARDVHVHHGSTTPPPQPQPPIQQPNGMPTWAKVGLVGLGVLGAGGIGATVANYFNRPQPTNTTITEPGQVFGVEVKDGLP